LGVQALPWVQILGLTQLAASTRVHACATSQHVPGCGHGLGEQVEPADDV
jgi:hypothetical protein